MNDAERLELERQRDEAVFQAQEWGFKVRELTEEMDRIKPVYMKLYRNPFFWLIRPYDQHIERRELFQCSCGKVFWGGGKHEFTAHKGHHYGLAGHTPFLTYLKVRFLPFLIPGYSKREHQTGSDL